MIKPIPYGRQNITEEDIKTVIETLQSDYLTQGPKIQEFENNFSKYVDAKYAVAVSNATAALHLSVMALGLKKGDRIITIPITFAASANCARFVGAEVWFADIDPDTYLIDLDKVKQLIESKPKGFFKGIIPVDFAGLPVNTEKLKKLADKNELWIIEDACHAPGGYFMDSKGQKQMCGNCAYSDTAVFSFHPVKHIACGEGGMITTNSKEIYEKLIIMRTHGITKSDMSENHGGWYYEMKELGFNYRLTDIQSALGITQLKKNKNGVQRRNEIARMYSLAFKDKFRFQYVENGFYHAYHLFIIEVSDRKKTYDVLRSKGILCQIHYIPIHTLPYYKKIDYSEANLSCSIKYYNHCLSLPMYPTLTNDEVNHIVNELFKFV
ncbi:UDP-4-amino-4,6-dideoxy-N-acetyl-beta-L-altrosamine transaminase [Crocinitomicaceae bacterium]|nr:UDP-4-amino-4,6-dideoxy-N-acetyl-beta-L-altrosamine transaminase [Crocinitomicaceae bacterium]